jgi:hypothetical protein
MAARMGSMQKRPPVPAMLPSSSGAATTPGNSSTARSTRAAIRPARSRFRHACSGAPAQRGARLVRAWRRARLRRAGALAPQQQAQEARRGACCAVRLGGPGGVRRAPRLGRQAEGEEAQEVGDRAARQVVDQPPAERPDHAHRVAGQQSHRRALGVLQQQRRQQPAAERPQQADLRLELSRPCRLPHPWLIAVSCNFHHTLRTLSGAPPSSMLCAQSRCGVSKASLALRLINMACSRTSCPGTRHVQRLENHEERACRVV